MGTSTTLISINVSFLKQGIELLERLSDEEYVFSDSSFFENGIGKHMRHILDHYESFVNGWDHRIDYDSRVRNTEIETSCGHALSKCQSIINSLTEFQNSGITINKDVLVRSNEGGKSEDTPWSTSSIKRELQFLISHTVHHYALIAFILKVQGIAISSNFGVAPSTLEYQKKQLAKD